MDNLFSKGKNSIIKLITSFCLVLFLALSANPVNAKQQTIAEAFPDKSLHEQIVSYLNEDNGDERWFTIDDAFDQSIKDALSSGLKIKQCHEENGKVNSLQGLEKLDAINDFEFTSCFGKDQEEYLKVNYFDPIKDIKFNIVHIEGYIEDFPDLKYKDQVSDLGIRIKTNKNKVNVDLNEYHNITDLYLGFTDLYDSEDRLTFAKKPDLKTLDKLENVELSNTTMDINEVFEIENLWSLVYVNDNDIKEIPDSIEKAKKLDYLSLANLKSLDKISDKIVNRQNITRLIMEDLPSLNKFPLVITDLENLSRLDLINMTFDKIPQEIVKLNNLESLTLYDNANITNLDNYLKDIKLFGENCYLEFYLNDEKINDNSISIENGYINIQNNQLNKDKTQVLKIIPTDGEEYGMFYSIDDIQATFTYNIKFVDQSQDEIDASKVEKLINALPTTITINDETKINEAKQAYDNLNDNAKSKVSKEAKTKLEQAISDLNKLIQALEQDKKDQQAASDVEKLINALPTKITVHDATKVNAAKSAYDKLNANAKSKVTKAALNKLNKAITDLKNVQAAVNKPKPMPHNKTYKKGHTTYYQKLVGKKYFTTKSVYKKGSTSTTQHYKAVKGHNKLTKKETYVKYKKKNVRTYYHAISYHSNGKVKVDTKLYKDKKTNKYTKKYKTTYRSNGKKSKYIKFAYKKGKATKRTEYVYNKLGKTRSDKHGKAYRYITNYNKKGKATRTDRKQYNKKGKLSKNKKVKKRTSF